MGGVLLRHCPLTAHSLPDRLQPGFSSLHIINFSDTESVITEVGLARGVIGAPQPANDVTRAKLLKMSTAPAPVRARNTRLRVRHGARRCCLDQHPLTSQLRCQRCNVPITAVPRPAAAGWIAA